ncbi:MAG TPA: hypothetical protein VJL61_03660 [Rhodanobacteraceae bacterium]|nr:hypothetical protein [Rhodanobacteraceae bacterium]
MLTPETNARWRAARPFAWLGVAAIIAGGLVAAVVAHRPVQPLVWMSAYLVLIVGVAQIVFGAGQAWLSERAPSPGWVASEWMVFNLANAGVIGGTLAGSFGLVMAATALFALGIALFLLGTRGAARSGWLLGYRILLGLVFLSSLTGLALSLRAR